MTRAARGSIPPVRSRRPGGLVHGLLVLPILLGACATRGDLEEIRSEIRTVSARQDSAAAGLRRMVDDANRAALDTVRALAEALFDFRGDASGNLSDVERQLDTLRELVSQFQAGQDGLSEAFDVLKRDVERRIALLAQAPDSAGDGTEADVADPADQPRTAAEEQALFDGAVTNLERALYTSALRGFNQFLDRYPRSALAPAAHLHRGEVLTQEGRLEDAITDYLEVPKLFPTSDLIPAALYRAGVLCIELEDYDRAREYLERMVNTYPEHVLAEQAREKLDEIP